LNFGHNWIFLAIFLPPYIDSKRVKKLLNYSISSNETCGNKSDIERNSGNQSNKTGEDISFSLSNDLTMDSLGNHSFDILTIYITVLVTRGRHFGARESV
jgi:hypothetical protein